jgi:Flp pilus assembly pilin Flp
MCELLKHLHADDSGAAFIEYTALLGVILAVGLGILTSVGVWVDSTWGDVCTHLNVSGC